MISTFLVLNAAGAGLSFFLSLRYFNRERERARTALAAEQERSDALLLNILPGLIALLERSLEACRRIGDRHRETALLSNLGDAQFAAALGAEAAASVRQSALIMTQIGIEGEVFMPEVWKLTEW
jgi:hypothetical protein